MDDRQGCRRRRRRGRGRDSQKGKDVTDLSDRSAVVIVVAVDFDVNGFAQPGNSHLGPTL
jgi:hypothetical protein